MGVSKWDGPTTFRRSSSGPLLWSLWPSIVGARLMLSWPQKGTKRSSHKKAQEAQKEKMNGQGDRDLCSSDLVRCIRIRANTNTNGLHRAEGAARSCRNQVERLACTRSLSRRQT